MIKKGKGFRSQSAFTLIELMVVVVVIGILLAGVFKLMGTVGAHNKQAQTRARMERIQNAISGFYSAYGTFPPVTAHNSPDPFDPELQAEDASNTQIGGSTLTAEAANQAARSQPVSFEYPHNKDLDEFVNIFFQEQQVVAINEAYGQIAGTIPDYLWQDIKMFKFGLLSFLLPRVEVIGFPEDGSWSDEQPDMNFYRSKQWKINNPVSVVGATDQQALIRTLRAQRKLENTATAKWMPNFEKIIYGGHKIFGVDTQEPHTEGVHFRGPYVRKSGGTKVVLQVMSIRDGWGNDFYYYSPPPYQSYRLWSSGPDGKTFPPWISLESLSSSDRAKAAKWIEDDVVGFDQ